VFAGHIGVALAAARSEPRVNVGVYTVAALLLDVLLWLFVLAGRESVVIPVNFAETHQAEFVFPYSHGLLAAALWSSLAGLLVWLWLRRKPAPLRAALFLAAVVFSHWLLDALVHRPELPLAGAASRRVGLGLWNALPVGLGVEAALVLAAFITFTSGSGLSRGRCVALGVVTLLVLALTIAGMTMTPPPPSAAAMAAGSLGTIVLTCSLIGWLGRGARGT
jgi:membrane-bound metal-dependent hydrolase YbcI (DUF457 family)